MGRDLFGPLLTSSKSTAPISMPLRSMVGLHVDASEHGELAVAIARGDVEPEGRDRKGVVHRGRTCVAVLDAGSVLDIWQAPPEELHVEPERPFGADRGLGRVRLLRTWLRRLAVPDTNPELASCRVEGT